MSDATIDNQQVIGIEPIELGWLGGIIDGEGCISLHDRSGKRRGTGLTPLVSVCNTDMEIIEKIHDILKRMDIGVYVTKLYIGHKNKNPFKTITVQGLKRVNKLLPFVIPVLTGAKRNKAILIQEYCVSRLSDWHAAPFTSRQLEIYHLMRELNTRGRKAKNLRDYAPNSRSSKFRFTTEDIVQTTTE